METTSKTTPPTSPEVNPTKQGDLTAPKGAESKGSLREDLKPANPHVSKEKKVEREFKALLDATVKSFSEGSNNYATTDPFSGYRPNDKLNFSQSIKDSAQSFGISGLKILADNYLPKEL